MPEFEDQLFKDALFRNRKGKGKYRIVEPPLPRLEGYVADTHAHLDLLRDTPLALARSAAFHVGFICAIADVYENEAINYASLDAWQSAAADLLPEILANGSYETDKLPDTLRIPDVRIAIGCHPHNAMHYDDALEATLEKRLRDPRTCAIGEIGLDYHYEFSPKNMQVEAFRRQIALAHKTGLPIILHLREAHGNAYDILQEEGFPEAGVLLHCFTMDREALSPWLEKGCYVAFGGFVTFKNSIDTRYATLGVPRNRILTETDAPYMAPEPMRGMECGPEHVIFIADKLAATASCGAGEERKSYLADLYGNALELLNREPTPWQVS